MSLQSNDGHVTNPVSYLYLMGQKNQLNMSILLSPFTSSVNKKELQHLYNKLLVSLNFSL